MNTRRAVLACAIVAAVSAGQAQATLITFTGGNVRLLDATNTTTNNLAVHSNVDYYDEGGFRLDFLPNSAGGASAFVGDYYGASNDVIHAHWLTGGIGGVITIEITKVGGGTFDLNYFTLTSNTAVGGGPATGNENTTVQGFLLGNPVAPATKLVPENWGFPATQIGFGPAYNVVDRVVFTAINEVDCFGMDNFYIDEIPAPGGIAVLGLAGLIAVRRRRA
jgi:hypothetical protein